MSLIRFLAAGAGGYALWRWSQNRNDIAPEPAAFVAGESEPDNLNQTRSAGPEGMHNPPRREWDKVGQAADENFPASDSPA